MSIFKNPYLLGVVGCMIGVLLTSYVIDVGRRRPQYVANDTRVDAGNSSLQRVHLVRVSYEDDAKWRQITEFFPEVVVISGPNDPSASCSELVTLLPENYGLDYFLIFHETPRGESRLTVVQWGRDSNDLYSFSGAKNYLHPLNATPKGVRIIDALLARGEDFGSLATHLYYNNEEDVFGSSPMPWKWHSSELDPPVMRCSHHLIGGRSAANHAAPTLTPSR